MSHLELTRQKPKDRTYTKSMWIEPWNTGQICYSESARNIFSFENANNLKIKETWL